MNTQHRLLSRRHATQSAGKSGWTHALIWVLLALAALLLVGFIAVVDGIGQGAELWRLEQRTLHSLSVTDTLRLLSSTGERLGASRTR
jgi:hypothetical protein